MDDLDRLSKLHVLRPQNPAELFDTALTIVLARPARFLQIAAVCALGPAVIRTLVSLAVHGGGAAPSEQTSALVLATDLTVPVLAVGLTYAFAARATMVSLWENPAFPRLAPGRELAVLAVWLLPFVPLWLLTWAAGGADPVLGVVVWFLLLQPALLFSSLVICGFAVVAGEPTSGTGGPVRRSGRLLGLGGAFVPYLAQLLCGVVVGVLWIAVEIGAGYLRDNIGLARTSAGSLAIGGALTWIAMSIACTAAAGIPAATYLDARIRREGLDVALVLAELEQNA